jgi:hypothetical protein
MLMVLLLFMSPCTITQLFLLLSLLSFVLVSRPSKTMCNLCSGTKQISSQLGKIGQRGKCVCFRRHYPSCNWYRKELDCYMHGNKPPPAPYPGLTFWDAVKNRYFFKCTSQWMHCIVQHSAPVCMKVLLASISYRNS